MWKVKQNLEELFENNGIHFIPKDLAVKLVKTFAKREANAVTHLFSEMGWKQKKVAWLKGTQKRCWYKQVENPPAQGDVCTGGAGGSDGAKPTWEPIWSQLERIAKVLHNEDSKNYHITVHDEVDLSRFRAAPGARLSHLSFECDRAFPAQC